jgi:uncharacterized protein YegL
MKQHIIVLVDISYSMQNNAQKIISGLNKFLESLKLRPNHRDILFSVLLFCDTRTYLCRGVFVDQQQPFTMKQLPQFGLTHLYDAIGALIRDHINEKRVKHSLFVITDGEDNGSKQMNKEQARMYCEEAVMQGWCITHCGVDVSKLGVNEIRYEIDDLEELIGGLSI